MRFTLYACALAIVYATLLSTALQACIEHGNGPTRTLVLHTLALPRYSLFNMRVTPVCEKPNSDR